MSALLSSAIKTFIRNADEPDIAPVLQELAMEFIDELPTFEAFLRELNQNGGDLSQILGRTHEPVGIRQFILDDYFLGQEDSAWPELLRVAEEIQEGGFIEALFMGAIGIGKTTLAQYLQSYQSYLLSCEKFPQLRYKLMPTSSIVMAMMNVTDTLAEKVTFAGFRDMLEPVPYFREHFSFPLDVKSEIRFPNKIFVLPSAADAKKMLGMNVIGGIVDELNFMQLVAKSLQAVDGGTFDQAWQIYSKIVKRRKSRFQTQGKMPGLLCVVSSKGAPGDFTERRKNEIEQENDGLSYVWERAQWEVTPADRWSPKRFRLEIGTGRHASRILADTEKARKDAEVLEVPVDLLPDFKSDMEGSLRDFAGRATLSKRPYFSNREKIWGMADLAAKNGYESVWAVQEWCFEDGMPPLNPSYKLRHEDRRRTAHIDLGVTSDWAGIAVGYVRDTSMQRVNARHDNTEFVVEEVPTVIYDGVLGIKPPPGGEIDFSLVRAVLYQLTDILGIPLKTVTGDGFQSVDNRQIMRKRGYRAAYLSVDGKESVPAYRSARSAVWAGRVFCPLNERLFTELARLEHIKDKDKIDHPPDGSKDTADAWCGVQRQLAKRRSNWRTEDEIVEDAPAKKPAKPKRDDGDDGVSERVQPLQPMDPGDVDPLTRAKQRIAAVQARRAARDTRPKGDTRPAGRGFRPGDR